MARNSDDAAATYSNFAPVARSFGEPFARSLASMSLEDREAAIREACLAVNQARFNRTVDIDRRWLVSGLSPERSYSLARHAS
jgi:hypothetical protein